LVEKVFFHNHFNSIFRRIHKIVQIWRTNICKKWFGFIFQKFERNYKLTYLLQKLSNMCKIGNIVFGRIGSTLGKFSPFDQYFTLCSKKKYSRLPIFWATLFHRNYFVLKMKIFGLGYLSGYFLQFHLVTLLEIVFERKKTIHHFFLCALSKSCM
jgi:hypothetical protein